jgi:hypothetical protein
VKTGTTVGSEVGERTGDGGIAEGVRDGGRDVGACGVTTGVLETQAARKERRTKPTTVSDGKFFFIFNVPAFHF